MTRLTTNESAGTDKMLRMFDELLQQRAQVYRAPGRVNIIGEHTDYNDGFVLPAAIDLDTRVVISPREDRKLLIHSESFSEQIEFDLDELTPMPRGHWSNYVLGVAVMLERAGYRLRGADLSVRSNVPIGAGLSSSAALEVAAGYALLESSGHKIDRLQLAKLCQGAENEFAGMRCGIMDQFIACFGRAGHAMMLDCRSLEYRLVPLPGDVRLVVCNTMVKHELASSEYNRRRLECEVASMHLAGGQQGLGALRDVTLTDLEHQGVDLDETLYKRCHHVITENARVQKAASAIDRGDVEEVGVLMEESHRSLRDDYEVSCEELDVMVELAGRVEGVYGARMTGGGFGGCTINLVRSDCVDQFKSEVMQGYQRAAGIAPEIYDCATADGVGSLSKT
ncbi:MAG TPA: galactokinase [Blastocatellia bacterium]|nr:galactokinase [Blastocatellia bacterium]